MEIFGLKGKTAAVTGAARGIGKAAAKLLETAGAAVARIDIDAVPGVISADVADEGAVEKAFKKIGPIDILVNNAGIAVRKNALEISLAEWERVIAVNLTGVFLCSRIAARSGCCPKWTTSPRQYCSSRGRLRDASRVSHCLSIRDIWPGKP